MHLLPLPPQQAIETAWGLLRYLHHQVQVLRSQQPPWYRGPAQQHLRASHLRSSHPE